MKKRKYFGTDGIRGPVGKGSMTPSFVLHLAYATGVALQEMAPGQKISVLIGKDTRISGYMLESALEAGFVAAGVDVTLTGPLPTPAVAYLSRALRMDAGVVISASHNPYEDNGIKFFSAAGTKLSDETESRIEALLESPVGCVTSENLGKAHRLPDAAGRYIEFCKSTFPSELSLKGLRLALDCANGAAYQVAPAVFHELGATVVTMGCSPTGVNINEKCGATHMESLQKFVAEEQADLGIALDGDADRILMVDASGKVYDGDALVYLLAMHHAKQPLGCRGVAGTLMSNLSLELALAEKGIAFERTNVGDRYVREALARHGWILGGETSGHVLTLDKHSTGDGIIAGLQILASLLSRDVLAMKKFDLADACKGYVPCPQVLINVRLTEQTMGWRQSQEVTQTRAALDDELAGVGRLVLRASGTEPVVRVMVEHRDLGQAQKAATRMALALGN